MVSKKAVQKLGKKIALKPIGTGAFYFDTWSPGEKVVLKKFKDYWGTPAKADEVVVWVMPEETVALRAVEKGELDLTPITQQGSYAIAKSIKNAFILESGGAAYHHHLFFNGSQPPLTDRRVRRALIHALDLKGLDKRLGPQTGYWPSPLPSAVFSATPEFWKYEYDVNKAKKLLAEAGYPKGFELKLIYKHEAINEQIALNVVDYWKKICDVKLQLLDRAMYYPKVREFKHHVAFIFITRFSPYLYGQFYQKGSPRNFYNHSTPEIDRIITKGKTATSEEESKQYWREFQKAVTEEAFGVWTGTLKSQMLVSNRVKGLSPKSLLPYRGLVDLKDAYFK
jgi:peptide/nickel transport system substrate-binding protein